VALRCQAGSCRLFGFASNQGKCATRNGVKRSRAYPPRCAATPRHWGSATATQPRCDAGTRQAAGARTRVHARTHATPTPPHHRAGERHTYIYTPQRVPTMFDSVALPHIPTPQVVTTVARVVALC
jgi:hypothetical protein